MTFAACSMMPCGSEKGFSLVEILVAMALSLILLGGVVTLFISSRHTYESTDHLARIQENGRFALDQVVRDLRSAGYLGCSKTADFDNTLNDSGDLQWDFSVPVRGYEWDGTTWSPTVDSSILSPAATNSDILVVRAPNQNGVVRQLTANASGTANLQIAPGAAYVAGDVLMLSDCKTTNVFEVSAYNATTGVIQHQTGSGTATTPGNASAELGTFIEGDELVPVRTVVYYVRANSSGTGNSLWRRVGLATPEELVEGVDSMQLLFGRDTNADRTADEYVTADNITDWTSIVSVRVGLLVRSIDQYGTNPDVDHTVLDASIPAVSDNRERLVFTSTVTLRNRAL